MFDEGEYVEEDFKNLDFKDTDLLSSTFDSTNLKQANLCQVKNHLIDSNKNITKNMKVLLPQATSFLEFFDFKVVD